MRLALTTFFALLFLALPAQAKRPVKIGILLDGPIGDRVVRVSGVQKELEALLQDDFALTFAEPKAGDWTLAGAKKAVDEIMTSPDITMVIALGVLVGDVLVRREPMERPAIVGFVLDRELQHAPFEKGKSGRKNLAYLTTPRGMEEDLDAFKELVPFKHLTVLVQDALLESFPAAEQKAKETEERLSAKVDVLPLGRNVEAALRAIPKASDAVVVFPAFQLSKNEFARLSEGLIERRLPSLSIWGGAEVEAGLLSTLSPREHYQRRARRIALHTQRILLGEDAGKLPVQFQSGRSALINMETARRIGFYPSWRTLTDAELINGRRQTFAREESMKSAAERAIEANLDLMANAQEVAASQQNIYKARSKYLPYADVNAKGRMIDADRAQFGFGQNPETAITIGGTVSQLLINEPAWAAWTVQEHRQDAVVANRDTLRLDIAQEAATAYLTVLQSKTLEAIQRDNLRITKKNLELAELRLAVGSADPSEVYRWQTQIARDQGNVIRASADRNRAEIALNRIVNRPLEESFQTDEPSIGDPKLLFHRTKLGKYLDNPWGFKLFRSFMAEEAIAASPEVRQVEASVEAERRQAASNGRSFWLPTVGFAGQLDGFAYKGGAGSAANSVIPGIIPADDFQFLFGLTAEFPLFTGLERFADIDQADYRVSQLEFQRDSVKQRVEQRVRSAIHVAGASFANIRLANEAAEASDKNLKLTTDSYSRGAVSIITLIDAQNAALSAKLGAANALYEFMIDWVNVQRAAGRYYFMATQEETDAMLQRFREHYETAQKEMAR